MKFRRIRNLRISYEKQGQIFFTLANYKDQPENIKKRIDALLTEASGGYCPYYSALRQWLIDGVTLQQAAASNFVREATLIEMRKKFYEKW